MCAPRAPRAYLSELARCGERDRILRILEHAKVKPDSSHNVGGIDAEFPKELRHLRKSPDTLLSL
jgi:hypothetical protein